MSYKEFLGHCFCDMRFNELRESIINGTTEYVLDIQRLNNELQRNPKHHDIKLLVEERLKV